MQSYDDLLSHVYKLSYENARLRYALREVWEYLDLGHGDYRYLRERSHALINVEGNA
jgi:hypothetical protein